MSKAKKGMGDNTKGKAAITGVKRKIRESKETKVSD